MEQNSASKRLLLSVLAVAILIIAAVGLSFAAYAATSDFKKTNALTTGTIMVSYTQPDNAIYIDNALPMDDAQGKALTGPNKTFDFVVSTGATNALTVPYEISITKVETSTLNDDEVKVYLTKEGEGVSDPIKLSELEESTIRPGSKVLYKAEDVYKTTGEDAKTTNYVLRMWIAKETTINDGTSKEYKLKVNVDSVVK